MNIEKSYAILGLSHDATLDEIKHAYRVKVKENHPDLAGGNPSLQKVFEEKMKEINVAYRYLFEFIKKNTNTPSTVKPTAPTGAKRDSRPKTNSKKNTGQPFTKSTPHSSARKRSNPDGKHGNPLVQTEKGFFSHLIERIITRLTRSNIKTSGTPSVPRKRVQRKNPAFSDHPKDFNKILNDILKAEAAHAEKNRNRRKLREKYDYFSMKPPQTRARKADQKGPVGSITPISRVNGVYRDH